MATEVKKKTLAEAIKEINKQYGSGSVLLGKPEKEEGGITKVVSTGSIGLDKNLEIGGIPLGKIVEIYGWESSGKSTLCQTIIGNAQKQGLKCVYVDGENSLDEFYAKELGVNLDDLIIITLDESAGEGAYNKVETLVETGEIGVVIIDSYNSLQPVKLLDGEIGDSTLGLHSRMMGQVVAKFNNLCSIHNTLFIFVGQIREKIGVMFGSPETQQGGNALKFYAHLRLKVSRSTTADNSIIEAGQKMGNKTTVSIEKTKFGRPFRKNSFNIRYKEGIDVYGELFDMAKELEIVKTWGKKTTYQDVEYATESFTTVLKSDSKLFEQLKKEVIECPY